MLAKHRKVDDGHSKENCSKKVTLSLKPHQMGMTENLGLCSKARWVAPKQGEVIPV